MGNNTPQCRLCIFLSLLFLALQLLDPVASASESESGESPAFYPASFVNYGNYSRAQCFTLDEDNSVDCLMQMLNTTDPPSIYTYWDYNALWEPVSCLLRNVTLTNRDDDNTTFNYCTVPLRGYDAFLFVSIALLATCMLFGKLSAVFVLIVGGIVGVLNFYVNLLQIGNSISLWLSIQPADLFFYAFLPPLLVEQAIRIDFFMFRKIWVHALFMAFVMVVLSCIALPPFILFVLNFQNRGWSWVHGGLLAAIISPTDALAVASILAKANGPERIVAVMEGESLFNDASAITLFEVFAHLIYTHVSEYPPVWPSVWSVIPTILVDIIRLSVIGVAIGLAMSWVTWHLLRWLRWRGARPYIETTVVLAVAYLSYYVTNSPAKGSGVIAVVVFGLYGNATSKWGMLASAEESGAFDAVWDMISFSANGLVFFWSGVASVNFLIRSAELFPRAGWNYGAIPVIYLFMMFIRCLCVALFNPVFSALGEGLSKREIFFIGFAGLRGSVSLIMVSAFTSGTRLSIANGDESALVNADISLWASAFVVLTLVINGPMIAPVLRWLKLNKVSKEKMKMRSRAKRALCRFTDQQINELRDDDDEFLQGANWDAVAQYVDLSGPIESFDCASDAKSKSKKGASAPPQPDTTFGSKLKAPFIKSWAWLRTILVRPGRNDALKVANISTISQKTTSIDLSTSTSATKLGRKKSTLSENGSLHQPEMSAERTPSFPGDGGSSLNMPSPRSHGTIADEQREFGAYVAKEYSVDGPGGDGSNSDQEVLQQQQSRLGTAGVYDPWEDITAEELAREMHDECPFFTTTEEEEAMASQRAAAGSGGLLDSDNGAHGGDIELGIMGHAASTPSSDDVVAAVLRSSPSQYTNPVASLTTAAGALPPTAKEGSSHFNAKTNFASIKEGEVVEEDQLCLTGTAGAKLLSELQQTMSRRGQTLPPDYYASLPAGAGAKLKQQLQQELGSLAGPGFTASANSRGDQDEGDGHRDAADYYCSLPALAGKKLQEELRRATEAVASAAGTSTSGQQQQAAIPVLPPALADSVGNDTMLTENPDYYTSMPAAVGRNIREKLQHQLVAEKAAAQDVSSTNAPSSSSSLPVDATTSLPAATGKAMQVELERRLQMSLSSHSRHGSIDGSSLQFSSSQISTDLPNTDLYSYHATVSGVNGSILATELKERMRSGVLPKGGSERDLLGRKMVPKQSQNSQATKLPQIPPFLGSTQRQQQQQPTRTPLGNTFPSAAHFRSISLTTDRTMTAGAPISMALLDRKKSNLHAFRKSATIAVDRRTQQRPGTSQLFRPSTATSQSVDEDIDIDINGGTAADTTTIASSSSKDVTFVSSLSRRGGAGDASLLLPSVANDPSAMLLARTFSVGASLHRRASAAGRSGGGSGSFNMARSAVGEDEDADEGTIRDNIKEDADGATFLQRQSTGDTRSGNGATMSEVPFMKGQAENSLVGEEAQLEAEDTEMLAEMRVRLLAGLKRHYVAKRLAGLLSVDGLRILQYACDVASDKATKPLQVWASLEKEVRGSWTTRLASRLSLWTTRGYSGMHPFFQKTLSWPFKKIAGLLRRFLGRKMLLACEVAVEYYVSLLSSPQIQWLKSHGESCWRLLDEVEAEIESSHHFLIEREIEAPDRFQAIQSYRAAMAVLRQQMLFVGELFETGMLAESEQHGLQDPIDKKMRHLELVGPVWRPPRPKAVLRSLPFMALLPAPAFRKIYDTGSFTEFRRGQCIWTATDLVRKTDGAEGPGGFVILSGVVKRVHIRPDGGRKEYFQGCGGIIGVLLCTTGTKLPGTELAIAEGNALGKGPVVFHVPQQVVQKVQTEAAAGDGDMIGLEEELARLSAAYVVESMDVEIVEAVSGHLEKILTAGLHSNAALVRNDGDGEHQQHQNEPLGRAESSTRMSLNNIAASSTFYGSPFTGMTRSLSAAQQIQSDQQQSPAPRRDASDANALHAELAGERRASAVSQAAVLPLGATGLATNKSVGANLAAMMRQIAALEYEDDEDSDSDTNGNSTMMGRDQSAEFGDAKMNKMPLSRRGTFASLHGGRYSFEGRQEEEEEEEEGTGAPGDKDDELETMMDTNRPSSPIKRGVHFSSAMRLVGPDVAEGHRSALTAALHRAPQLAADVSLDIRRALHTSFVMKLDAGSYFVQTSHVVLIAGSLDPLKESSLGANAPHSVKNGAPAVLPWLWHDRWMSTFGTSVSGVEVEEWQAGVQGAHVVVAYNLDGSVPACVLDYEERMEEKERERKASIKVS